MVKRETTKFEMVFIADKGFFHCIIKYTPYIRLHTDRDNMYSNCMKIVHTIHKLNIYIYKMLFKLDK